ncbi:MAG: oligosaccharide flippase family protein [Candidatus Magnetominusculus sp. LBB02]|nr:oligosaccharide flippase family protein [Candidatus Magnetominusculus sp. LBB02]
MSRQFFRNAALLAVTEVIVKLKPLIAVPLLTRHFGALNYGVWSQMSVIATIMPLIILLGTDGAIIRYMPGTSLNDQKRFFAAWMVSLTALTTGVCFGIFLFKREISMFCWGQVGEYERFIPVLAAAIMISIEISALNTWFRVHNDARTISAITISQSVLGLITILIVLVKNEAVYQLIIYNIFADALVIVWLMMKVTRKWGWSRPDFSAISVYLRYGLPIIPHGLAVWGLNYMDRFFLVKYSTLTAIGIYSVSYSIGYAVIQIFIMPVWTMYPNTAAELYNQGKHAELQRLFDRSVGLTLVTVVPSIVILYVTGERLLAVFTTREFIKGGPVIAIIAAGYLFHIMGLYYEIALWLIHKQVWSTFSVIAACVLNCVANIILIPRYSIMGAAAATSAAFLAQLLISYSLAVRFTKINTNFAFLSKIVISSLIMGFAVQGVSGLVSERGLISLMIIVISGVISAGLLYWAFNIVDFKKAVHSLRQAAHHGR